MPWDVEIRNLSLKYTRDHPIIVNKNQWIINDYPEIDYYFRHCRLSLGSEDVIWDTARTREVITMFWSSLNPTPAQPAFPLSSNSTVSPILWYVTKKSQSSLDVQESGILKLPCVDSVVVGS